MKIDIRLERPTDIAAIESVTLDAFRHAPHSNHAEHLIVNALRETGGLAISLVAELEHAVIGHVALSRVDIDDASADWFGLGPISVRSSVQRRGIGSELMRAGLQHLRAQRARGCVLLGEPGFYSRFGFRAQSGLTLAGVPPEYFLALSFVDAYPTGIVSYHPAFLTEPK